MPSTAIFQNASSLTSIHIPIIIRAAASAVSPIPIRGSRIWRPDSSDAPHARPLMLATPIVNVVRRIRRSNQPYRAVRMPRIPSAALSAIEAIIRRRKMRFSEKRPSVIVPYSLRVLRDRPTLVVFVAFSRMGWSPDVT
jgi:hypothetical protein